MSTQQIAATATGFMTSYKMAILWFILFSVNSLCTSIILAITNVTWTQLDTQAKFMIYVSVAGNWTGTIMAFISKKATKEEIEESEDDKQSTAEQSAKPTQTT